MLSPYRIDSQSPPGFRQASERTSGELPIREYFDKLMRLIPAEIVAIYPPVASTIPEDSRAVYLWPLVALVILIITRARLSRDPERGLGPQWGAVCVSAVSFLIWVYTLDGILVEKVIGAYYPHWSLIAVIFWTYLTPLFFGTKNNE